MMTKRQLMRLEFELMMLKEKITMAKKQIEGVELANKVMLESLAAFLVKRGYYLNDGQKVLSFEEQTNKAKFDISKRGKLYKLLEKAGVKTRYDIAFNFREKNSMSVFEDYEKIMKMYRTEVIKQSFKHRKDECK